MTFEFSINFPKWLIPSMMALSVILKVTGLVSLPWIIIFILPVILVFGVSILIVAIRYFIFVAEVDKNGN